MKTVLWISRHQMTADQFDDLERIMGDSVQIEQWADTIRDSDALHDLLSDIDHIDAFAVVLPPELLQETLKAAGNKPVIRAVSERVPSGRIVTLPDGRKEREFRFKHVCWEQILKAEFQTRRL